MSTEIVPDECKDKSINMSYRGGSDSVYGLGLIGAWVYYIGRATTFQEGVTGFFKGIFWPAFLVFALLNFLEKE